MENSKNEAMAERQREWRYACYGSIHKTDNCIFELAIGGLWGDVSALSLSRWKAPISDN